MSHRPSGCSPSCVDVVASYLKLRSDRQQHTAYIRLVLVYALKMSENSMDKCHIPD